MVTQLVTQNTNLVTQDKNLVTKNLHYFPLFSQAVQFTTEAPAAASLSVADFNAQVLNSNTVELTWSATKCASKYNVYQR